MVKKRIEIVIIYSLVYIYTNIKKKTNKFKFHISFERYIKFKTHLFDCFIIGLYILQLKQEKNQIKK
ncbi:MAG: hypothetical protein CL841_03455 [Crocinitomicaceae bacterium]|nr:hypothetical protein [Crocinitomicaceae bacterium]